MLFTHKFWGKFRERKVWNSGILTRKILLYITVKTSGPIWCVLIFSFMNMSKHPIDGHKETIRLNYPYHRQWPDNSYPIKTITRWYSLCYNQSTPYLFYLSEEGPILQGGSLPERKLKQNRIRPTSQITVFIKPKQTQNNHDVMFNTIAVGQDSYHERLISRNQEYSGYKCLDAHRSKAVYQFVNSFNCEQHLLVQARVTHMHAYHYICRLKS